MALIPWVCAANSSTDRVCLASPPVSPKLYVYDPDKSEYVPVLIIVRPPSSLVQDVP